MNFLLYDEDKWIDIQDEKHPLPQETPIWIKQDDLRPVPAMRYTQPMMSGIMAVKLKSGVLKVSGNEGYIKVTHWQPLIEEVV